MIKNQKAMEIIKYNFEENLKNEFINMNKAWINRLFKLENEDIRVFSRIDDDIKNGADIFFTKDNNNIIACIMVMPLDKNTCEIVKFAVKEGYQNKGAGSFVLKYAIDEIKKKYKRAIIATNTKCYEAIHLYKKYGFTEFKTNNTYGFDRVDICFELNI